MVATLTEPGLLAVVALFGLLVGSFLNVCIYRLPRHCLSIVKPRSRCTACLALIRWYDNIPVVSYIVLRAKCRRCGAPISARYPLIELLTAAFFTYIAWRILHAPAGILPTPFQRWMTFAVLDAIIAAMIVATFVDWEFRIIPDEITIPGIPLMIVLVAAFPFIRALGAPTPVARITEPHISALADAIVGAAAGAGIIYSVGILGKLIFRKDAMGLGDVKYLAVIGAFIGWQGVLTAFMIACVAGSFFGVISWIVTRDRYIAFGPYLSIGSLVIILWRDEVRAVMVWYQSLLR